MKSFIFLLIFLLFNTPVSFTQTAQVDSNYTQLKKQVEKIETEIKSLEKTVNTTDKINNKVLKMAKDNLDLVPIWLAILTVVLSLSGYIYKSWLTKTLSKNQKDYLQEILEKIDKDEELQENLVSKIITTKYFSQTMSEIIKVLAKSEKENLDKKISDSLNDN